MLTTGLPLSPAAPIPSMTTPAFEALQPAKTGSALLNEVCQRHKLAAPCYTFTVDAALRMHVATLTMLGQTFSGVGSKKATAKNAAAEQALALMTGDADAQVAAWQNQTARQTATPPPRAGSQCLGDPVSLLNELCMRRRLAAVYTFGHELSSDAPGAAPLYMSTLTISGLVFVARASRKAVAKKEVARAALQHLDPPGRQPRGGVAQHRLLAPSGGVRFVTSDEAAAPAQLLPGSQAGPQATVSSTEGATGALLALELLVDGPPSTWTSDPPTQPTPQTGSVSGGNVADEARPPASVEGITGEARPPPDGPSTAERSGEAEAGAGALKRKVAATSPAGEDPVSLLNEYAMRQRVHLDIVARSLQPSRRGFLAQVVLHDQTFCAEAATKGLAKKGAATLVLQYLETLSPEARERNKERSAKNARTDQDGVGGPWGSGLESESGGVG